MNISVIIAAAGSSQRMGLSRNKVLLPLLDKPVLSWSLQLFQADDRVKEIIVAAAPKDLAAVGKVCEPYRKARVLQGGVNRSLSVTMALAQVGSSCQKVAVHDGARPLLAKEDWERLVQAAQDHPAVVPMTPLTDSIKALHNGRIVNTVPRETLAAVQTPQIFDFPLLLKAHRNALRSNNIATDDSQMVEKLGVPIFGVYTQHPNLKITYQEDLLFAEMLLRLQQMKETKE